MKLRIRGRVVPFAFLRDPSGTLKLTVPFFLFAHHLVAQVSPQRSVRPWSSDFRVTDTLPHQDDGFSNMLAGDADHDGLQEIVITYRPIGGSTGPVEFYEDDGEGHFALAFSLAPGQRGLLAMGDVDADGLTDLFLESGGNDKEYSRFESLTPSSFPSMLVWNAPQEGETFDFRGCLDDADGDGEQEFIVADSNGLASRLKIFESRCLNQMTLIYNESVPGCLGNPVVGDLDGDGRNEIVVCSFEAGGLLLFEALGNDQFVYLGVIQHGLVNAYQAVLIDESSSPDSVPRIYVAGQRPHSCSPGCVLDYVVQVYDSPSDNGLRLVNEIQVPDLSGASIPQIFSADLFGSSVPEIVLDRLGGPVPVYEVGTGGALSLFDVPMVWGSDLVVATRQTPLHSGAIAVGTHPSGTPNGDTVVLRLLSKR